MINYNQVKKIASNLLLSEETIEKDYFIEIFLYYISRNKDLKNLVFRGGTCLKKIYFSDYRFSEDLDFLVKEGLGDISKHLLKVIEKFNQDFPVEAGEIEEKRVLKDGRLQIFFSYNIVPEIFSGSGKELKVDILEDNFLPPFRNRPIKFSYQDLKEFKADLSAYDLESVMADKISRLFDVIDEPRDVYDLWKLMIENLKFQKVKEIFQNKHGYFFDDKDLILEIQKQSYKVNWKNRLSRQIPNLPDFKKVKSDLERLIKIKFN